MNREILRIALPAIITNVTIPLLGLVDSAIAGHLGAPSFIGAIAVGAMMFNLIYWSFGFLRMSTSGLTAQEYGRGDHQEAVRVLKHAITLASMLSLAVIVLQLPLQWVLLRIIGPSPQVEQLARQYFFICVWGAPPILIMMSVKGWLLGMQNSRLPMMISIFVNVVNVIVSLLAVYVLDMGFIGIAFGTLISEWVGLAYSLMLLWRRFPDHVRMLFSGQWRLAIDPRYFSISGDIFLRSLLLMLVNLAMVSIGARSGDLLLAVNSLMQQLNTFFAYFLDGIAFAGEALVGKYYGARNKPRLSECVRQLFVWSTVISVFFTIVYAFPHYIFALLTSQCAVIEAALDYRWWCALLPIAGMTAFVWDGVFVGLTRSRGMLLAVATAAVMFFAVYFLLPQSMGNHRLWLAFVVYLVARGLVQTALFKKVYSL